MALKHIVFIKLMDNSNSQESRLFLSTLSSMLNKLPDSIKSIRQFEVGMNISSRASSYDMALQLVVDNENDLDEYRNHPEHVKVLAFMKTVALQTAVVDYIIADY